MADRPQARVHMPLPGSVLRGALGRLDAVAGAHATDPVPDNESVPGYRIAIICVGIAFTLTGLYTGSALAASLGLAMGTRAIVWGSIILAVMSVPSAIVGARTRLSTYMIVSRVFGANGARIVNLMLAIVLLGWYAVTAELFGRTFFLAAEPYLPVHLPQGCYTIACSALVIATTIFGFRAIDRLSLAAAPLLVALTVYVAWAAEQRVPWEKLYAIAGTEPDLATGISAVIGGLIVAVVLMPDMTRYSRSALDCAVISFAGNGLGGGAALFLAMIPALAFHEGDPMKYMLALGLVGVAFAVLVVSTWTINAVNLYSTGLVTSTALKGSSYGRIVVLCGIAGTVLAVMGVADRLIDFLVLLGLVVPPICSVYLTDFFVLGRREFGPAASAETELANLNGLAACCTGAAVGILTYFTRTSLTGVPTIESFVSAAMVYALAEWLRVRSRRNRLWRMASARA
jgi:cytosine permease